MLKHVNARIKTYSDRPGALLSFVATATTSELDRDGDRLKSGGARLDPRCPLLFSHDPKSVIGRVLGAVKHTSDRLDVKCEITDFGTSSGPLALLARDCAVLVKSGILACSIGFNPSDVEESRKEGERYEIGAFEILELSLVSIPSCRGAIVQHIDAGKCRSAMLKSYLAQFGNEEDSFDDWLVNAVFEEADEADFDSWLACQLIDAI